MLNLATTLSILGVLMAAPWTYAAQSQNQESQGNQKMIDYLAKAIEGRNAIPPERHAILSKASNGIKKAIAEHGSVDLIFVCTHNSRRSQFGQVWAAIAANHYKLANIRTHSCGTETTSCNPRTVAALVRAGLRVSSSGNESNPLYSVSYSAEHRPVVLFSKAFGHDSLPKEKFIAMMCCDHADENCPVVPGALDRVRLSYVDPKISDDTQDEAVVYDERCLQIATEMLELMYIVSQNRS